MEQDILLSDGDIAGNINFISAEGAKIPVSTKIGRCSEFLLEIINEYHEGSIPIPFFTKHQIKLVVKYCNIFAYQFPEPPSQPLTRKFQDIVTAEEWAFLNKLSIEELCEFADIADYLDINYLVKILCAFTASLFQGKNIDLIRAEWEIEPELDEEMMDEIKKKFPWADQIIES
ncbi:unnamed protein product [Blepharisma stoltei]|uniref:SKP1 component dimerisation domain-containing protein n=1 Tax=Blepharisma stoltei TaxID=1481888 RepID=A0AAU9J0G4_9CILI|nr:unnamed protein product [Blepharisma stoltei]